MMAAACGTATAMATSGVVIDPTPEAKPDLETPRISAAGTAQA